MKRIACIRKRIITNALHFKNSNLNIKLKTTKEDGIAITVSGDNEKAKKVVSRLINEAGFEAVDAESLAQSWRQQPGTPAYCTELNSGIERSPC